MNLSEIDLEQLRDAIRSLPNELTPPSGLRLCCLQNCHTGKELILPELPPNARIPWRFEGNWKRPTLPSEKPLTDFAPEPHSVQPLGDHPILRDFAFAAIYC